ncbi:hypothetical protein JZL90_23685 [Escherichia coli]|nr:hypothetical protein [Escherichia coli]
MTAKDLAYLIKFDGNYKDGMTVWLFSCNTGKGQNSFASQLAKELHTNVIGPDTLWTWWGRGTNGKLKMDTVLTAPTNLNSNKDLMAITTKDLVDSIGQRNSYVKTWGCGGFLNETNIYSRGKSLCF